MASPRVSFAAALVAALAIALALGGGVGCAPGGAPPAIRTWLGFCLLPQAGVAIGMALLAAQRFPAQAGHILPVVLASTVVFELLAPPITRGVLDRLGVTARAAAPSRTGRTPQC